MVDNWASVAGRANTADNLSGMGHFTFSGVYLLILTLFNLAPAMFELYQSFQQVQGWISEVSGRFNAADKLSFEAIGVSVTL